MQENCILRALNFKFSWGTMPTNPLVELVQIAHVKSKKRRFEVVPLVPWIPKIPLFLVLVSNKLVLREIVK